MKRTIIILAIIGISLTATTATLAQDKRRSTRQSIHVNGTAGNDKLAVRKTATNRSAAHNTSHDGRKSVNWGDGQNARNTVRTGQITASPAGGNYTFRSQNVKDGTSNTMMGVHVAAGDINGDGVSNVRRTESGGRNENITIGGGRAERNGLTVNGTDGNDQVSLQNRQTNTNLVQGNYIGTNAVTTRGNGSNILSGTPTANGTFSRSAITFEGNDEPLWAKARKNSSANAVTAQNVGPQINGNVRPKGFANTTFDDQAALSANKGSTQQIVQGNQIGVNARPRRTGITPDYDLDGDVDGTDFLMKGSSQKQKRTAGGTQSLAAGTYGRGNP